MKVVGGLGMTTKALQNRVIQETCIEKGIDINDWKNHRNRHDIQDEVSKKLFGIITGRTTPLRPSRPQPNKEIRIDRMNIRSYPKHLKTDVDKFKYLKGLLETKQIPFSIYLELLDCLDLKGKISKKKQMSLDIRTILEV